MKQCWFTVQVDVDVDANAAPVSAVEEETEPRLILRPL
jgi:hypothetical protein